MPGTEKKKFDQVNTYFELVVIPDLDFKVFGVGLFFGMIVRLSCLT